MAVGFGRAPLKFTKGAKFMRTPYYQNSGYYVRMPNFVKAVMKESDIFMVECVSEREYVIRVVSTKKAVKEIYNV